MRLVSSFVAFASLALALGGCRDPQITTYKVPKEPVAAAPADANHKHVHAGASVGTAAAQQTSDVAASMPASGSGAMASTPVATASGAGLTWTGPAHWQSQGAGGMRKGTFTIPGEGGATAELAITAFPNDVGGDVANVNRWRGQIQLAPQSPEEALRSIQRLEANGLKIGVVEIANPAGTPPTRVLSAIVPYEGSTWFFKLSGPDALVAKEKAAFMKFVQTIKPAN